MPARSEAGTVRSATPRSKAPADVTTSVSTLLVSMQEEGLDELIELCRQDPRKILPLLRVAKQDSLVEDTALEPTSGEKPFHMSYTKLQRIPKDFLRSWLPDVLPKPNKFDDTTLKNLERNEPGSLRQIFYVACKVLPTSKWPKLCLERDIFRETFARCHAQNGALLKWGVYIAISDAGGVLSTLRHVTTKRDADISDLGVPANNFCISQNWEPFKAAIKWKRQTQNLFELFPKDAQRKIKEEMRREDLALLSATVENDLGSKGESATEGDGGNAASSSVRKRREAPGGNSDVATPPSKMKRRKIVRKTS